MPLGNDLSEIGKGRFPGPVKNPLERLRKAYRLCRHATNNIERSRKRGRATRDKAEYLAKAILNLREIQEEIERAGSEIKRELISWNIQFADTRSRYPYYRNTRFRMR